tara:strand:- start:670 stop:876 length:207 start_codon:yes stop_codon:yes gene_type:complete
MENMDELLDNIITDGSPSQISDAIKDLLYAKTAEKVNSHRSVTASSLFNQSETEVEVSDDELETSDGV